MDKYTDRLQGVRAEYISRVVGLLMTRPDLSYPAISRETGASLRTVERCAARAGIKRPRGRKPKKEK